MTYFFLLLHTHFLSSAFQIHPSPYCSFFQTLFSTFIHPFHATVDRYYSSLTLAITMQFTSSTFLLGVCASMATAVTWEIGVFNKAECGAKGTTGLYGDLDTTQPTYFIEPSYVIGALK